MTQKLHDHSCIKITKKSHLKIWSTQKKKKSDAYENQKKWLKFISWKQSKIEILEKMASKGSIFQTSSCPHVFNFPVTKPINIPLITSRIQFTTILMLSLNMLNQALGRGNGRVTLHHYTASLAHTVHISHNFSSRVTFMTFFCLLIFQNDELNPRTESSSSSSSPFVTKVVFPV